VLLSLQQQYRKLGSVFLKELQVTHLTGQIEQLSRYLPPAVTEGCLEIDLIGSQGLLGGRPVRRNCDLWATLPSDQGARQICHEFLKQNDCLDNEERNKTAPVVWSGAYRLLREWSSPGSDLARGLGDLFFEFDTGSNTGVTPIVVAAFAHETELASARSLIRLYCHSLSLETLPETQQRQIDSLLNAIPQSGFLRHVALMSGRDPMALRLVVTLRLLSVVRFLETLGWEGPLDEVVALLKAILKTTLLLGVQFDVGDTVKGKIGLEIAVNRNSKDRELRCVFDYLQTRGMCCNAMRQLLEHWLKEQPRDGYRNLIIKVSFPVAGGASARGASARGTSARSASAKGYLVFT